MILGFSRIVASIAASSVFLLGSAPKAQPHGGLGMQSGCAAGTAVVSLNVFGSEQEFNPCLPHGSSCPVYDQGAVVFSAGSVGGGAGSWQEGSTPATVASGLAESINDDNSNGLLCATANGGSVTVQYYGNAAVTWTSSETGAYSSFNAGPSFYLNPSSGSF